MSAQVAEYAAACEAIAQKFANGRGAKRVGAEFDDLYQEGLISVWKALRDGVTPSAKIIEYRMRDWIRHLDPQVPGTYDELLPLDGVAAE